MTDWFEDTRARRAQDCAFEAELAEGKGDWLLAKERYREAAEQYRSLALALSTDDRQGRSIVATSGAACFARAGDFGEAMTFARRMLAQGGALTERGRTELARMAANYAEIVSPQRKSTKQAPDRQNRMRAAVRQVAV